MNIVGNSTVVDDAVYCELTKVAGSEWELEVASFRVFRRKTDG